MFVFPGFLVLHAIGMAFLAGPNAALDLRILGFAPRIPLSLMERFFPVMRLGFVVNAFSGALLLIGYPTKALTNPIFYIKLACIGAAIAVALWIQKNLFSKAALATGPVGTKGRVLAVVSLVLWAGAIFSGRLLAYTCTLMMADLKC